MIMTQGEQMKKILPPLILLTVFSGFVASQIIWDMSYLGAQQIEKNQDKNQLFESLFNEIKLTTIDNQVVEPKTLKTPVVVVNFWASWCLPCLKEFPSLVALNEKYKSQMTVVAINGDDEEPLKSIEKTRKKYDLDFLHVIDPESVISDKFLVSAYPFSLIYVNGKLIHSSQKNLDFMGQDLVAKIDKALKDK
jgi:thiol-disulfide isomerase/thioredoxin